MNNYIIVEEYLAGKKVWQAYETNSASPDEINKRNYIIESRSYTSAEDCRERLEKHLSNPEPKIVDRISL